MPSLCRESLLTHLLLIDNDSKFTDSFDAVFEAQEAEVKRVGPRAPNMNAYAERWIPSLRIECLDHFVICGENHLAYLVREYVEHFNLESPTAINSCRRMLFRASRVFGQEGSRITPLTNANGNSNERVSWLMVIG